jgi:hypothetical protein
MRRAGRRRWAVVAAAVAAGLALRPAPPAHAAGIVLDDFETLTGWTTMASEGAHVWIAQEPGHRGMGMRVGFDLSRAGGWIIVRRTFALALPENYAFTFMLRGEAPRNNAEFKLVDARGRNVWWRTQRNFSFPREWQRITIRKSRLEFAWGPAGGGEPERVGAIELAISAGEGGSGSVWIDDLVFEEREPAGGREYAPDVHTSTALGAHEPALMLDGDARTAWKSEPLPRDQWVLVDLARNREYGGLVIDWDADDYAMAYEVQVSTDASTWTTTNRTATGHGGRDYIYMPDTESRFIRLSLQRSSRGRGYGIVELAVKPFEFSASPDRFFEAIARDAPPGAYPKYLSGRQTYWTVVGVDGDDKEALLNEEGMLEIDKGAFSIEPFLYTDTGLVTWHDVTTAQRLEGGYLPIPTVTWTRDGLSLTVTAFGNGEAGRAALYARYRLENHGSRGEPVQLFLAIRPFQVNPPWQTLNTTGGVTNIQELRFDGRTVWVDRDRAVVSLTPPDHFGAATFEEGSITEFLAAGKTPPQTQVMDPLGFASGALQYNFYLGPQAHAEVALAVPLHDLQLAAVTGAGADGGPAFVVERHEEVRRQWERVLGRVEIALPPDAQEIAQAVKTTIAYILINRDGPAIRPGSRNYARSWIRDGMFTSSALLAMGFTEPVRDFLRWFAPYQGVDGKVPCCVDRRGADPVLEHDGPGAFIHAIAEYYRYTRDIGFLSDLWPHVVRAVDYLAGLRRRRMTDEYRAADKLVFFGLLPESISHEGYAAHPVHSYWDDFLALRGLKDAAALAAIVGDFERARDYATLRDEFRETLYASLQRVIAERGIDYIPGSVELADFDPTSTAVAIVPGEELEHLPPRELANTFERYWTEIQARKAGTNGWQEYTPYELRNVGALVRLGQKARALELLAYLLADQRPAGWNQWSEIAWRDPTVPRFIGDMPHTWVGAGFVRSVRTLFAFEREADQALVLAAGVPAAWVAAEPGVTVRRLPTYYGVLNYTLRAESEDTVRLRLAGDLVVPPGKIVVHSPFDRPLRSATVNGQPVEPRDAGSVVVDVCPADVLLEHWPAAGGAPPAPAEGGG